MNKKEQIDEKIKELIKVTAEPGNKTTATLVLSSFTSAPGLVGNTVAIEGSILSLAALILKSMYDIDVFSNAVLRATKCYLEHDKEEVFG